MPRPAPVLGAVQLEWLSADLALQKLEQAIVVLTHRPLFSLYPQWDWATRDGDQAIAMLMPFNNVTVFYGHIHHEHHHMTGHIAHHATTSTMFPLGPVGTVAQKTQTPWNSARPYRGLGWRTVQADASGVAPVSGTQPGARVSLRRSVVAGLAGLVFGGGLAAVASGQTAPRVVAVRPSKIAFLPAEI